MLPTPILFYFIFPQAPPHPLYDKQIENLFFLPIKRPQGLFGLTFQLLDSHLSGCVFESSW